MRKLYRFNWYGGRMGYLHGMFAAEESDVANAIGETVHFGEVLGKHSDVTVELEESHMSVVTEDQDFIAKFESLGCASGHNPLHYVEDEGSDEEDEAS